MLFLLNMNHVDYVLVVIDKFFTIQQKIRIYTKQSVFVQHKNPHNRDCLYSTYE